MWQRKMRTRKVQAEGTEAVILHAVGSTHLPPEYEMELKPGADKL